MSVRPCAAVVLAGDREATNPVAHVTNAPCKALSPVSGTPMLWRVIETLRRAPSVEDIVVVGPAEEALARQPEAEERLRDAGVVWLPPAGSPAASADIGLRRLPANRPALITTADHPLLKPATVESLLDKTTAGDLVVGLVSYRAFRAEYPEVARTAWRLGEDAYCGCNLFLARTDESRRLITLWRRVEHQRKHPARILAELLGWGALARYVLGRLTLTAALARLSARVGVDVRAALLDEVETAIDVDTVADLRLVEAILARR